MRLPRLKNCPLMAEKDLKKKGRGSYDYCLEESKNIVAVKWFDNKAVHLVSSYIGVEPIDAVRRDMIVPQGNTFLSLVLTLYAFIINAWEALIN